MGSFYAVGQTFLSANAAEMADKNVCPTYLPTADVGF
jgi:hypothetical protein